jgi:hypothetical protein
VDDGLMVSTKEDDLISVSEEEATAGEAVEKLGKAPPTFAAPSPPVEAATDDVIEVFTGLREGFSRLRERALMRSSHVGLTRQALVTMLSISVTVTVMTCPQRSVPMALPG